MFIMVELCSICWTKLCTHREVSSSQEVGKIRWQRKSVPDQSFTGTSLTQCGKPANVLASPMMITMMMVKADGHSLRCRWQLKKHH